MGYTCARHRADALARLAGELGALEQERFESHQSGCHACRAVVEALGEAVLTARREPSPLSASERDEIYAALQRRIAAEEGTAGDSNASIFSQDSSRRWTRKYWPWLAGAVATAALAAVWVGVWAKDNRTRDVVAQALVETNPRPGVHLRATPDAVWRVEDGSSDMKVALERGTILVHLAKQAGTQSLTVQAPGARVRVLGTTFAVRTNQAAETEVAVAEGQVIVQPERGAELVLLAGQMWQAGKGESGSVVPARGSDLDQVADWRARAWRQGAPARTQTQTHETRPAQPQEKPQSPVSPASTDSSAAPTALPAAPPMPAPTDPGVGSAYRAAEEALAQGHVQEAATILERIVAAGSDSHDADTARLELARLYAGPLGRPVLAREHLRTFLDRHPTGAGARSARALLCEITSSEGCPQNQP